MYTLPEWATALLSASASSLLTFYLARRKNNAEAQANELANVEKAISIWRDTAQSLDTELKALESEYGGLTERMMQLKQDNADLKRQVGELIAENDNLKRQLKSR